MDGWNTSFLLGWSIFGGYVKLRASKHTQKDSLSNHQFFKCGLHIFFWGRERLVRFFSSKPVDFLQDPLSVHLVSENWPHMEDMIHFFSKKSLERSRCIAFLWLVFQISKFCSQTNSPTIWVMPNSLLFSGFLFWVWQRVVGSILTPTQNTRQGIYAVNFWNGIFPAEIGWLYTYYLFYAVYLSPFPAK